MKVHHPLAPSKKLAKHLQFSVCLWPSSSYDPTHFFISVTKLIAIPNPNQMAMDDGVHRRVACRFARPQSRGSACTDYPPDTYDRSPEGLVPKVEDTSGLGRARRSTVDPDGQELPDWLSYATVSNHYPLEPHGGNTQWVGWLIACDAGVHNLEWSRDDLWGDGGGASDL